jgi:hypothetical protein
MKSAQYVAVHTVLVLEEAEREFLHNAMQNPLYDGETPFDAEMRQKLFDATKEPTCPTPPSPSKEPL